MKKINNKLKNVNFLMKYDVFASLLYYTDSITDNSKAYIPTKYHKSLIENSNGNKEVFEFIEPNDCNNYADLCIVNSRIRYNFKAVRVKSLEFIDMNGSHICWNELSINYFNFLVFYSTNPDDMGKIFVVDTKTYADLFVKNNMNLGAKKFNAYKAYKFRNDFDKQKLNLKLIDYSMIGTEIENVENIGIKYLACYKTLKELNENPISIMKKRTHYGKRYVAYNFKTDQMITFRDCSARNEFFKLQGIKLADNHVINRNCKIQDDIVNGNISDSTILRTNIYEESGWIILNYMSDDNSIRKYVKSLLHKLVGLSVRWKNRLISVLEKFDEMIEKSIEKLINVIKTISNKINYKISLNLINYITCTNNVDMKNYSDGFS